MFIESEKSSPQSLNISSTSTCTSHGLMGSWSKHEEEKGDKRQLLRSELTSKTKLSSIEKHQVSLRKDKRQALIKEKRMVREHNKREQLHNT
jgi:hypothetical protein